MAYRLRRGEELLSWLEGEGCTHAVRLGATPDAGGIGVFAERDVSAGHVLLRCPLKALMRPSDTKKKNSANAKKQKITTTATGRGADDDDGKKKEEEEEEEERRRCRHRRFCAALDRVRVRGQPLDDRSRLQLLLLREKRAAEEAEVSGSASKTFGNNGEWAPYVQSLPGRELVETLPIGWSDEDLERRVRGTTLLEEVRAAKEELRALAESLASARERGDDDDDDDGGGGGERTTSGMSGLAGLAFGFEELKWAYAVFWSRALVLQLPGGFGAGERGGGGGGGFGVGGTECLVPLLVRCVSVLHGVFGLYSLYSKP